MMQRDELLEHLAALREEVGALFLPTPGAALQIRPHNPIQETRVRRPIVGNGVEAIIWESRGLDTKGYTLQNGYCSLRVRRAPVDVVTVTAIFQGSYGNTWAELARSLPVAITGPGNFDFSAMTAQSLSLGVRISLLASYAEGAPAGEWEFNVDGNLVAGLRF